MWECEEKDDFLILAARETDFIQREVKVKFLMGLRKRISASFLRILRCPDFNPEIARFGQVSFYMITKMNFSNTINL